MLRPLRLVEVQEGSHRGRKHLTLTLQDVDAADTGWEYFHANLPTGPGHQWRIKRIWPEGNIRTGDVILCQLTEVDLGTTDGKRMRADLVRRLHPPPALPEDEEILRIAGWRLSDRDGLWRCDQIGGAFKTRTALHRMMSDSRFHRLDRGSAQLYLAHKSTNWVEAGAMLPLGVRWGRPAAGRSGLAQPDQEHVIRGPAKTYDDDDEPQRMPRSLTEALLREPPARSIERLQSVLHWFRMPVTNASPDHGKLLRELEIGVEGAEAHLRALADALDAAREPVIARYEGMCTGCGSRILVGERIARHRGGWQHVDHPVTQ